MKTPQEQAEAMLRKISPEWALRDDIVEEIPLTELITVAQAAVENHKNHCNPKYCKLCASVYALRETGKIEL